MKTINPSTAQLRMLASIKSHHWFIRADNVQDYALSVLEAAEKSGGEERSDSYWEQFYTLRKPVHLDANGIAHVEVRGALLEKAPPIYEMLGLVTRYSTIVAESKMAKAMGAKGVLYFVDSPGGTVSGVIEGGEAITNLDLPTVAFCSGLACSAAYWLASGAGQIVATPSAFVGNIGAIISWADCDQFWADMGITFKALVSEGADLKSTFHLEPDETQLEFLQGSINSAGESFKDHVKAGRAAASASLDPEVFRAGWYSGEDALVLGLIDGIGTREDAASLLLDIS
jgi:ClpP class serine protease